MAGEINTTTLIANLLPDLHSDSLAHLNFWSGSDLIQWCDEAVKRLARACMIFCERDTSITTAGGTATYSLPTRHIATIHASYGTSALRPAAQIDLESRDPAYQTTAGPPDHWYEDKLGTSTIGLAPVPTVAVSVPLLISAAPSDLDVGQLNVLVQAPAPLKGYLAFSVLAAAYGREGESEQPDLAQHCAERVRMFQQILSHYYGAGL